MLVGSVLWGQVVGTIVSIISTFNPEASEFRRTMDELNRFLRTNHIEYTMRQRLREYFHQTKHIRLTQANHHLIRQMSPQLQGEVSWMIHKRWLARVPFLKNADHGFVIQMSLELVPLVFVPGELLPTGYLYIVHRGLALYGGKVLGTGKVWGEDMILANSMLQRKWCARSMNYLEVYTLSREALQRLAASFPNTEKELRRAVMMLALRRYLQMAIREMKAEAEGKGVEGMRGESSGLLGNLEQASSTELSDAEAALRGRAMAGVTTSSKTSADGSGNAKLLVEMRQLVQGEMAPLQADVAQIKQMLAQLLARGGGTAA